MELLLCETRVKIDSWYKDYSQASLLIHFPALRPGLGIRSFAHRLFAHLLRSLKSNEQLWAICSDRSGQRSDCEPIAQVTHDKWATVSDSLRSLMINEQNFKKSKIIFFGTFFVCLKKQMIAHSLFFNEWCERIAQAAHQKWASMSYSLRSLTKNELIARFFSESLICSFFCKKRAICSEKWWANFQPCLRPRHK